MRQKVNDVYEPLFKQKVRYFILMGGRGAGRSTVASQFAMSKLIAPEYFRCAIMRYVLGDIRNSIYREIIDRAEENQVLNSLDINEGVMSLQYGANSINAVGFKKSSGDQKSKLKSLANYTTVIIEEADEIPEADFVQLDDSLRTLKGDICIVLLLNPPPKDHWIVQRWFDLIPSGTPEFYIPVLKSDIDDTVVIRSSFEDNLKNLSQDSIDNYRRYERTKPDHFWNMVKGYVPEVAKGKIFSNWRQIETVPFEARLERRGMDFGYSNDPTTITDIYKHNGGFIFDEQLYQKGLSNKQIADIILSLPDPQTLVVADSAEPKSIDEIRSYGVNIIGAVKGKDSINQGIQFIKFQKVSVTKRSINLWKEFENYCWMVDKDGNTLNTPKDIFNHAMDGIRYALASYVAISEVTGAEMVRRFQERNRNIKNRAR